MSEIRDKRTEEIAVDMPVVELLGPPTLALVLRLAEIHNEAIAP